MSLSKIVLSFDLGEARRIQVHENNEVFIKDLATKMCTFFRSPRWKWFIGLMLTSRNTFSYHQLVKGHTVCSTSAVCGMFWSIASFLQWTFVVGTKIPGLERR